MATLALKCSVAISHHYYEEGGFKGEFNGGEFKGRFHSLLPQKHIMHLSLSHNPNQSGIVERRNKN
ncbi:hypothetical protein EON65_40955 [archaeon]|nr:MAG: hypothetical protein EON65_40955 [archaeon]